MVFNGDASALGAGPAWRAPSRAAASDAAGATFALGADRWSASARRAGFRWFVTTCSSAPTTRSEFDAIFRRGRLPAEPTPMSAPATASDEATRPGGEERLFVLVNAPASGARPLGREEIQSCEAAAMDLMRRCGLDARHDSARGGRRRRISRGGFRRRAARCTAPASHGWRASFTRPGARSRLPGLYLAGGSVHPGPGVPMAALSGRQAALAVIVGPRFDAPVRPGGYALVVRRRVQRRRPVRPDDHRASSAACSRPITPGAAGATPRTIAPSTSRSTARPSAGR